MNNLYFGVKVYGRIIRIHCRQEGYNGTLNIDFLTPNSARNLG